MKTTFTAVLVLFFCTSTPLSASYSFEPGVDFLRSCKNLRTLPNVDTSHLKFTPHLRPYTLLEQGEFAEDFNVIGGVLLIRPIDMKDGLGVIMFAGHPWFDNFKKMTNALHDLGEKLSYAAFGDVVDFLHFSEIFSGEVNGVEENIKAWGWKKRSTQRFLQKKDLRIVHFNLRLAELTLADYIAMIKSKL